MHERLRSWIHFIFAAGKSLCRLRRTFAQCYNLDSAPPTPKALDTRSAGVKQNDKGKGDEVCDHA
jgi:hypothetical protein